MALTPTEEAAVLYWPRTAGIAIFAADTRNKAINKAEWQKVDYSKVDFEKELSSGEYDNGIAIRLGKTLSGKEYVWALDFDGWDAIAAWFGGDTKTKEETWSHVKALARRTRIEWHDNYEDGKIHIILKSCRPLGSNRKIHIGNAFLEVRCENQALFVSPSIHKGGNRYKPLDSEDIWILDNKDLLRTQASIDSLAKDYMSDVDKQKYEDWLDKDEVVLGVGQGRHDATKFMIIRCYWKYSGEWLNYSDEQRFERAWDWHVKHCNPPRSREEFDRICKWVIDTFRKDRDSAHEEERSKRNNFANMPGCVSYQINTNPDRYIVSTPDNKLVETVHKWVSSEENPSQKIEKVYNVRTFLACKPIEITKHVSPLKILEKEETFTMVMRGHEPSGNFTITQKTRSEIVAELKKSGNTLSESGIDIAINAVILAFEETKKLVINSEIAETGFFIDETKSTPCIISSGIEIATTVDTERLRIALEYIDELADAGHKGRLDLLAHTLKWFTIAPFGFVFKQGKIPVLKGVHLHGRPNTTKSTSGIIGLAIDGHESDSNYILSFTQMDTVPRLGDAIDDTTFPKVVNEVDLEELPRVVEALKTSIDEPILRKTLDQNRTSKRHPAFSSLFLTGNPPPPLAKSSYAKRFRTRYHSDNEVHQEVNEDAKRFDELLTQLSKLYAIGRFRNKFVMDNQSIILDKNLLPFDKSIRILSAMYETTGLTMPQWLLEGELEQTGLQESIEDNGVMAKRAFESYIDLNFRNAITQWAREDPSEHGMKLPVEISGRLAKLVDSNLLADIKRNSNQDFIIFKGILLELYKYGLSKEQLPNLPALEHCITGAVYGKSHGNKVIKCTGKDLHDYFDGIEEFNE